MDWEKIWTKKALDHKEGDISLEEILRVNGYDVQYAKTNADTIRIYVKGLIEKLDLSAGDNLLEIGCGAGAIAIPMMENGIRVTGIDICKELIDIAKLAAPDGDFLVADALDYNLDRKDYDAALSQGVFQFFDSEEYGAKVFEKMLEQVRPGGFVAITDLLDKANEESLMKKRVELIGEEEYKRKYVETGLTHQFYNRSTFEKIGSKHCSKFWIEDQFLENATADFKYNIYAIK